MILTTPISGYPARTAQSGFAITVLYTAIRPTLRALRQAALLARDLGATVRILNVRVVPYPLPLDRPSADRDVLARNISTLADGQPIPTSIEICFGRDVVDSLLQSLNPHSIVLIGAKRRWWLAKERRWAKQLSRQGHHVIFVPETATDS